jgi:hypothetical protein
MRWPTLAAASLLAVGLTGCDRIPFIGGGDEQAATTDTATVPQPQPQPVAADSAAPESMAVPDTTSQPQDSAQTEQPPATVPSARQAQQPTRSRMDEPWTPTQTGTIENGMTRTEVTAVWGAPAAERGTGEWVYLFYRNGCEVSCGTADVVLLHQGQVVDAIVRGVGHTYAGVSSSPPDSPAQFTPPGPGSGEMGS